MLDEDCDIGKLEGSVEECGVQGFAEWEVCGFHGIYSIADLSGSGDDVRDVDDQQTGNNADGQIYIRTKEGKYIPKPPYVPTAEEVQAAKLAAIDAEYSGKLEENKSSIIVAATVDQDEEYADELRVERQTLQAEYIEKRSEIA